MADKSHGSDDRAQETTGGDEREEKGDSVDGASDSDSSQRSGLASLVEEAFSRPREYVQIIKDCYFTFDRRTLGFTRILLGFFLITDLIRRTWAWEDMFANNGVLPTHVNLFRHQGGNFTFLDSFATPLEVWALWCVILFTYICLLIGFKTKAMQVLSLLWVTSMNGRVLLIENGGYVVHNLLLLWTCFLPLGDRFSVDAMRASMKRSREATAADLNDRSTVDDPAKPNAFVTALGPILLIQLWAIYFFNYLHKTGPAWKNGTAVHYVLYVDRMVTPFIALVRDHIPNWLILFMTKSTLAFELAMGVCLFSPLGRAWARRLVIFMMNALHLGFGTTFVLGPFAWSLCVFSTLLFGHEDWEVAYSSMRRMHRARKVLFDPRSPGVLLVCRLLKRMDRFELLTFEASTSARYGLAVEKPDGGDSCTGALALADIVAALPLGPSVAWMLRLPGVRSWVTTLMAASYERDMGRAFGLHIPKAGIAPAPSALYRGYRLVLAGFREVALLVMFAAAINQAMIELWVVRAQFKVRQPEPLRSFAQKLRFLQGWFMFSPNPVMDDGTIVVDAVTIDGRHVDPFMGQEPNFDLLHAKSFGYSQIWSDYFNRMHLPSNAGYREAMKDYMFRYPERTGRVEDTIVSGDVYWVKDWNPKWGQTNSYGEERDKLFSFENPKARQLKQVPKEPAGWEPPGATPPEGESPSTQW